MNKIDILKKALDIISDQNRWTKRTLARTVDGIPTSPHLSNAVNFCAVGALRFAAIGNDQFLMCRKEIQEAYASCRDDLDKIAARNWNGYTLVQVNDEVNHEAVVQIFKTAIEELPNEYIRNS